MSLIAQVGAFRPRAPWWGGDLQTLRNSLQVDEVSLPAPSQLITLPMSNGSGDRLLARLNLPSPSHSQNHSSNRELPEGRGEGEPLIVLIHGLTGCEDSAYMLTSAAFHLARGRAVLRLNLRGAGPSRQTCRGHYHAGCADDIRDALRGIDAELLAHGLVLIGYSLGGNVVLNLLAQYGDQFPIRAAVTVSAPIVPQVASKRLMAPRNWFYHNWLLRRMKDEATAPGAELSADERAAIMAARTIWDYDDTFVAPRHGFANALDYYQRVAGAGQLGAINVASLLIHARNDPWIPAASYEELAGRCGDNIQICISPGGGHVGFHGADHKEIWHDRLIEAFLRKVLSARM